LGSDERTIKHKRAKQTGGSLYSKIGLRPSGFKNDKPAARDPSKYMIYYNGKIK
jgi:hypothetical protein